MITTNAQYSAALLIAKTDFQFYRKGVSQMNLSFPSQQLNELSLSTDSNISTLFSFIPYFYCRLFGALSLHIPCVLLSPLASLFSTSRMVLYFPVLFLAPSFLMLICLFLNVFLHLFSFLRRKQEIHSFAHSKKLIYWYKRSRTVFTLQASFIFSHVIRRSSLKRSAQCNVKRDHRRRNQRIEIRHPRVFSTAT